MEELKTIQQEILDSFEEDFNSIELLNPLKDN